MHLQSTANTHNLQGNNKASTYIIAKSWVAWFVGYDLLLVDFEPYGLIFTYVCVIVTVAMVKLLRDAGSLWDTYDYVIIHLWRTIHELLNNAAQLL
jgi:hypothetical protein